MPRTNQRLKLSDEKDLFKAEEVYKTEHDPKISDAIIKMFNARPLTCIEGGFVPHLADMRRCAKLIAFLGGHPEPQVLMVGDAPTMGKKAYEFQMSKPGTVWQQEYQDVASIGDSLAGRFATREEALSGKASDGTVIGQRVYFDYKEPNWGEPAEGELKTHSFEVPKSHKPLTKDEAIGVRNSVLYGGTLEPDTVAMIYAEVNYARPRTATSPGNLYTAYMKGYEQASMLCGPIWTYEAVNFISLVPQRAVLDSSGTLQIQWV